MARGAAAGKGGDTTWALVKCLPVENVYSHYSWTHTGVHVGEIDRETQDEDTNSRTM